jgi:dTDP-4-amino-4,6-dideoxygalactose transaminase
MNVPFVDLRSEHQSIHDELMKAWERLLDSASFIGGPAVEAFERSFAEYCQIEHAIGVGNGTDALTLALTALQIGPGDEVILPANSFVATAEGVVHAGATPVFVDIDPRTYNIDPEKIEEHITPRTKAVIAVHLYGQPADMDSILAIARTHALRVIEDAAQAHGARYNGMRAGSMGDVACFSFYPAKNLGACGDGGAVVTNDSSVAETVWRLRDHGGIKKYQHDIVGFNSRLDSMQAVALNLKLPHLDERNAMRRRNAQAYAEMLSNIEGVVTPFEPEDLESVYHLYVVRITQADRRSLQTYLAENGVQTGIHYPAPIHQTRAFARYRSADCPLAETYGNQILSLPMYPGMKRDQVQHVASLIRDYMVSYTEAEPQVVSTR